MEVAFLDADQAAPAPPAARDERGCLTALVVSAEADQRHYVRECLRERTDLRLIEAATVTAAIAVAAECLPDFVVVDERECDVLATLSHLRAIVIVDDVPHGVVASGDRIRLLARPFTAKGLMAEVGLLLG